MEYEYTKEIGKPTFALVISPIALEKLKESEPSFIEAEEPKKLDDFKSRVESQMVGYYDDVKDIQIATIKAINEIVDDYKPLGWVKADNTTSAQVAEELARLTKENNQLKTLAEKDWYNGLSADELKQLIGVRTEDYADATAQFKKIGPNLTNGYRDPGQLNKPKLAKFLSVFSELGLIKRENIARGIYKFTDEGRRFYLQLLKDDI